jgi:diguanylate cyclase (GGDEF)-like protein
MELLLWRWSTAVQVTSLVMIAVFFTVLGRSIRTAALRWWVRAWQANFAALAVTSIFWFVQPSPGMLRFMVGPLYMSLKMAFVVLLLQGAWAIRRPGTALASPRALVAGLATYAVLCAVFVRSLDQIGVVQHTLMGVLLVGAGVLLVAGFEAGLGWVAIGFLARGALSLAEAAAYALQLAPRGSVSPGIADAAALFRSAASSFDSGAEWLLALGCVLAVSEWVQRELLSANADLLIAQEDLRRLADRDPLTGLANRRALPEVLRAAQPAGATLVFFDLDGFKQINDLHGHQAGDDTLRRFAAALRESFRPADAVVRYAGDEFLVIAKGLDATSVAGRIEALRDRLRRAAKAGPAIGFSVGTAEMAAGSHPDLALNRADEAMYEAKRARGPLGAA